MISHAVFFKFFTLASLPKHSTSFSRLLALTATHPFVFLKLPFAQENRFVPGAGANEIKLAMKITSYAAVSSGQCMLNSP